eukprot:403369569
MDLFSQILIKLQEQEVITDQEVKIIVFNQEASHLVETHQFVVQRMKVFLENVISQATEVNHYREASRVLIELTQKIVQAIKIEDQNNLDENEIKMKVTTQQVELLAGEKGFFSQIMKKGLINKGEIYDNQKILVENYLDQLYKILKDFPMFEKEEEPMQIILLNQEDDDEDLVGESDEEEVEKKSKQASPQSIGQRAKVLEQAKTMFQKCYLEMLNRLKSSEIIREILNDLNRMVIPNFQNPIFLSDFLSYYLDQNEQVEIQVLALKAIFILLEKHGLDYPQYYKKLYNMIKPQLIYDEKLESVQMRSIFQISDKSRFLRLLDLSLRSPSLPTKMIAAFLKRLSRIVVSYGSCFSSQDLMFTISFIANMLRRHPRCYKLVSRKKLDKKQIRSIKNDPYREDEADPMESRALHSCLWEIEILMKQHFDSKVRDFAKIFKTDLHKKTSYFKSEEFTVADPLELLVLDLNEVDEKKEGKAFKKNLLVKHGQSSAQLGLIGQKRTQDMVEDYQGYGYRDQTEGYKRYKYGEEFEDVHDILSLHH